MMYEKIFEAKYRDAAAATDYLNSVGWKYVGRRGWLRKYHRYSGVWIDRQRQVMEQFRAHLYEDGHVVLYADPSISRTLGISSMPFNVWGSKDAYEGTIEALSAFNFKLINEYGFEFTVELEINREGRRTFSVYRMVKLNPDQMGKSMAKPAVNSWDSLHEAFQWAASESQRINTAKRA